MLAGDFTPGEPRAAALAGAYQAAGWGRRRGGLASGAQRAAGEGLAAAGAGEPRAAALAGAYQAAGRGRRRGWLVADIGMVLDCRVM